MKPLVLLHGWGLSSQIWSSLLPRLAGEVIALDLPGHGATPAAHGPGLADWSDALVPKIPLGATLCGWSLGALIALDLARRHPARVGRLILLGATPRFVAEQGWPHGLAAPIVAGFQAGFATDPVATLRRFVALQTLGDARRRQVAAALSEALPPPGGGDQAALAAGLALLADTDLRPGLGEIHQPVRLLHGQGDALMPVAAATWLADALPQARLTVLEDCGHAPFLSRPADCATLMDGFRHD